MLVTQKRHQLYAKLSKCRFGVKEVNYLDHIVSTEEVKTDSKKITSMIDWPKSSCLKSLRRFLGLTGYYRKLIKNYGIIAVPLTDLLKKKCFTLEPRRC